MNKVVSLYISDHDLATYVRAAMHHYGCTSLLRHLPEREVSKSSPVPNSYVIIMNLDHEANACFLDILSRNSLCPVVLIYEKEQALDELNLFREARTAFLKRPFTPEQLATALESACQPEYRPEGNDNRYFFGEDRKITKIRHQIEKVSKTDITVLIQGESGTGKEIVARLIHDQSPRRKRQLIKVNGAAIPKSLLESELFGYEKGAFTGAYRAKPGKFDLANGGTLFLDEVGSMSPPLQSRLLQVLQNGEFSRLGGVENVYTDVRVIAATNADLLALIEQGKFRLDLYYRLNVANITIPPLRERKGDIRLLKEYFLERHCVDYNRPYIRLSRRIVELFLEYSWPGNVRELENIIRNLVVLGDESLTYAEISDRLMSSKNKNDGDRRGSPVIDRNEICNLLSQGDFSLRKIGEKCVGVIETEAIKASLEKTMWNRRASASLLGISYKSLLNKMHQYKIDKN